MMDTEEKKKQASEIKLVKIVYEYEDGTRKILTGEDVKKYEDWTNKLCVLADMHGQNPQWEKLAWEVEAGDELERIRKESIYEDKDYPYGC